MPVPIHQRTYDFALRVIRLHIALLRKGTSTRTTLADQVLRSGTSVGACVQEATSAESKADFIHKISIAQKEAREAKYWLGLIADSGLVDPARLGPLRGEANEIVAILSAVSKNAKRALHDERQRTRLSRQSQGRKGTRKGNAERKDESALLPPGS